MEHSRHQVPPHPLPKGELAHRSVNKAVDLKNLVERSQVFGVGFILDLVDSFQQLKGLAQPQVPVQLAALSKHHPQVPHHPFAVLLGGYAVDQDLAAGGPHDAGEHLHGSAFSCAVGAYVAYNVPFFNGKRDVIHRPYSFCVLYKEVFYRPPAGRAPF